MSDSPRVELQKLLQPLVPKEWTLILSERTADQHGTILRLQAAKIRRHPVGGTGVHLIDFTATVTVDGEDLERAEDQLDDELTELVQALDTAGIGWDEWSKAIYDGHLGYQSNISLVAQKEL